MTAAALDYDAWIRTFDAGSESGSAVPGLRLVCFPHAGGSASFYFPYAKLLRPGIEVLAVQYPGRQDRRGEPCLDTIDALADRAAEVLRVRHPNERLAFFGHSMGAAVAFETVRRLEHGPGPRVLRLFASGRRAPSVFRPEFVHRKDDDGLVAELQALSGTHPALLDDPELRALVLPTIRSDYRAIETYRCAPGASVACPVTVLIGDADPRVSEADARPWAEHTRGGCDLRVLPGGHFYLEQQRDTVVAGLRAALREHL
ncbi:thioesterase II family protein [Streptomyces camelliae]|uniref:Alpha/beta fold hydrolase n=1 Tax=Streptomyces camelliae TaxID=3004093 RepID=A0ABY7P059_9ACTN|nr:alpha/beta fold hydrolase [Streptomyces sp. HUAS 2-6]WBO62914.1 alpha/beta fold hydrolase [Streptomyces sp. HUAS 2-6]